MSKSSKQRETIWEVGIRPLPPKDFDGNAQRLVAEPRRQTVYGSDREPSPERGIDFQIDYRLDDTRGIILTRITITPSDFVLDPETRNLRLRRDDELGEVNSSALSRIRINDIRESIRRRYENLATASILSGPTQAQAKRLSEELAKEPTPMSPNPKGRPRYSDALRAKWAEDCIRIGGIDGYRDELLDKWETEEPPVHAVSSVDSRVRVLVRDGWLEGAGVNAFAGPRLKEYRRDLKAKE